MLIVASNGDTFNINKFDSFMVDIRGESYVVIGFSNEGGQYFLSQFYDNKEEPKKELQTMVDYYINNERAFRFQ